ncbi:MAG: histidine phosphatase family protein [Acidobacteriota bacterium]
MGARVFLVRHGATVFSAEDRFAGETDVALSDEGRDQARKLGQRLANLELAAAYASPMGRTVETASLIAEPHGISVEKIDGLKEISHGAWEGHTRAEVEENFPDEYARWEADPFSIAPRNGESGLAVTARALPALLDIIGKHETSHVLVVSHKATIRLILSSLLGFDSRTYRDRLDQSLAALNVLDFNEEGHARLALFNDVSHYAPPPASLPPLPKQRLSKWWDRKAK